MIRLTGNGSIPDIVAISDGAAAVAVPPEVLEVLDDTHRGAAVMASRYPTYGRTTGVGANKDTDVAGSSEDHGLRLLRSHAVDAGSELPAREVRAMLAVRLNQLCIPGSGIDPAILRGLTTMLNDGALPSIRRFGSIGTGDLTALAGTALTLMGERQASRTFVPMTPWGADSALSFISSSALSVGQACLAVDELQTLTRAADVVFALSFVALGGNPSAFSPTAAKASAAPGVVQVAERLRIILGSNQANPKRIQDPYALRVYAIAQAGVTTAFSRLAEHVNGLMNTAQENPLFDEAGDAVVHHGAFYQSALALDLDGACLAIGQASTIGHARIRMMNEPAQTGLEPFLAVGPPGSSGVMMVEYVAAAAIAEIRNAAQPASLGTLSLSRGAEEDAPFAAQGIVQLQRAIGAYRILLACELVGAVRVLRQLGLETRQQGLLGDAMFAATALPSDQEDRDLRGDLDIAAGVLDELGSLTP